MRRAALTLTLVMGFDRITIMTDKIKTINPYSGESEMLTPEEHALYTQIKQDEITENYSSMTKGISKFSRMNPKAYMTLLD